MSRLARDGTAEPNSRDKRLIRVRGQLIISRIDKSTQLMPSLLKMMTTQTYIYTHKCLAIDKSRSCMGVVVAAIVATADV